MQNKIYGEIVRHFKAGEVDWIFRNAMKFGKVAAGSYLGRPLTAPLMVGLMVTYRCNLLCQFCDYPLRGDKRREFNTQEFQDIIREVADLGTSAIGFAGGETTLREDIWTLVRTAVDQGLTTSLGSNGVIAWPDDKIKDLFDSGLHMIGFSVESTTPYMHDLLQAKQGAWEKVCDTIRRIDAYRKQHNKKIRISVSVNFNPKNLEEVMKMPEFAKNLGADQVNYIGMESGAIEGRTEEFKSLLRFTPEDIRRVDETVDKLIALRKSSGIGGIIDNSIDSLEAIKIQSRGQRLPVKCHTGYTSLYIDCYGQYYSCMSFMEHGNKVAGRYEKGKLKEFWYSKQYNEYRAKHLDKCRDCFWPCQNEMNYLLNPRKYIPLVNRFDPTNDPRTSKFKPKPRESLPPPDTVVQEKRNYPSSLSSSP